MSLGKTPWVDRTVRSVWERVAVKVPSEWMPVYEEGTKSLKEYGCGHYGCVMPTSDPNVVLKLTSDPTEADFIAAYQTLEPEEGIVRYHKILRVEGGSYRRRPLWLIWRSAATEIGVVQQTCHRADPECFYEVQTAKEALKLLVDMLGYGRRIRERVRKLLTQQNYLSAYTMLFRDFENLPYADPESYPPNRLGRDLVQGTARGLRICYSIAQNLANTNFIYHVGEALVNFMDEGIFLADLHTQNIGVDATQEVDSNWIITDPGHAVFFHPKWATLPLIEEV